MTVTVGGGTPWANRRPLASQARGWDLKGLVNTVKWDLEDEASKHHMLYELDGEDSWGKYIKEEDIF